MTQTSPFMYKVNCAACTLSCPHHTPFPILTVFLCPTLAGRQNLTSVLFDLAVCPILPTTGHSSGGSNSIVGVGSYEGSSSGWTSFNLDVLGEEEEEVAHPLPNSLAYPGRLKNLRQQHRKIRILLFPPFTLLY
ncbi:hypothetical protein VNO78_23783 [Psophocarpus tetragonolobus]|uniref:Uncharacterized protein n=1 Tax=Psophocarpus tetragonolobus TaxID=3891 RepID=A0AAN9S7C4_PSOTE